MRSFLCPNRATNRPRNKLTIKQNSYSKFEFNNIHRCELALALHPAKQGFCRDNSSKQCILRRISCMKIKHNYKRCKYKSNRNPSALQRIIEL